MFWKKTSYVDWDDYADIVSTWDTIAFTQHVRNENIKHMRALAETL